MTIAQIVADVAAVLGALGLDRPVLVGSSMGATFAVELALRTLVPLAGIVAVDAPGHWATQGMTAKLAELRTALRHDRARALTVWVDHWYGPAVGSELRDWTVRQILDASPFIDALLTEHAHYDWRPDLASLTVPVTFVHGRLDAEIPVAVAEEAAALVPGGEVVVVDGAGHLPHQEQPDAFNAILRAVVDRLAKEGVDASR
jgi:non-heme chloroperoxidase